MSITVEEMLRRAREQATARYAAGPQAAPGVATQNALPIAQMQARISAFAKAFDMAKAISQQPKVPEQTQDWREAMKDPNNPLAYVGDWRGMPKKAEDLSEFQRSFQAGVGDVYSSIGGALKWIGAEGAGEKMMEKAAPLQAMAPKDVPEWQFTWKNYFNPRYWTTEIARSLPFTLALIPIGILGAYTAAATGLTGAAASAVTALGAKAAGMGAFGKAVVGALAKAAGVLAGGIGAGALQGPAEAAMEAGGTYNEAIAMGMSDEEADAAADSTFRKNLALLGLSNTIEWGMGKIAIPGAGKLASTTAGKLLSPIARAGLAGVTEAAEEAYQEWAQASSLGKDFSLGSPEAQRAMMAGFAMGGGQSMTGVAQSMATLVRNKVVEKVTPEQGQRLKASVEEKLAQGIPGPAAVVMAMDELASTPEGKAAVEAAVEEIVKEQVPAAQAEQPATTETAKPKRGRKAKTPAVQPVTTEVATAGPISTEPVQPTEPAQVKVPTIGPRAEFKPGQVVYHPTTGQALTIVDATDPALLTAQNAQGTTLKIGKGAVRLEAPQAQQASDTVKAEQPESEIPANAVAPKIPGPGSVSHLALGKKDAFGVDVYFKNNAYRRMYEFGKDIADDATEYDTEATVARIREELDLPADVDVWQTALGYYKRIASEAAKAGGQGKTAGKAAQFWAGPLLRSDLKTAQETEAKPPLTEQEGAVLETFKEVLPQAKEVSEELIQQEIAYLEATMKKGVIPGGPIRNDAGEIVGHYPTISQNERWYQEWMKTHKRPPTKAQLRELAIRRLERGGPVNAHEMGPNQEFLEAQQIIETVEALEERTAAEPVTLEAAARAKTEAEMPEALEAAREREAQAKERVEHPAPAEDAWKLTLDEYIAKYGRKGQDLGTQRAFFGLNHRKHIEKALSEGKQIPEKVLADYPDLAEKAKIQETAPQPKAEAKAPAPSTADKMLAKKFRSLADGMQKQIDAKRHPAVGNQNPTARRNRMVQNSWADADRLESIQTVMRAMADRLEDGTLPELLKGLKSRVQVEAVLTGYYREPAVRANYVEDLIEATKKKPNTADDRAIAGRVARRAGPNRVLVPVSPMELDAIERLLAKDSSFGTATWLKDDIAAFKRLTSAGIQSEAQFKEAKELLASMTKKETAEEAKQREIKKAEMALTGLDIPGYFPTPKAVVDRILEEADIKPGMKVLEPSAGKGNIADAVKAAVPDSDLSVNEINPRLLDILKAKGYEPTQEDFLTMKDGQYDRIVMNPPFEQMQDADHVRHAYDLLKPGGRLVSIMSPSAFFRSDKKATSFREWFEEVGGVKEDLPQGSFKSSERPTGVATVMVTIDKPGETKVPAVAEATASKTESPWHLSLEKYIERVQAADEELQAAIKADNNVGIVARQVTERAKREWAVSVQKALAEGEDVPLQIAEQLVEEFGIGYFPGTRLADYPRIAEKYGKPVEAWRMTADEYVQADRASANRLEAARNRVKPLEDSIAEYRRRLSGKGDRDVGGPSARPPAITAEMRQGISKMIEQRTRELADAREELRIAELRASEVGRAHRTAVMQALREGKPVPERVLADYPDLAKQKTPAPSPREQFEAKRLAAKRRANAPTIYENKARGEVELRFKAKPDEGVLSQLREAGFEWSKQRNLWWAKASDEMMAKARAIREGQPLPSPAPEAVKQAATEAPTPSRVQPKPAKPVDAVTVYKAVKPKRSALAILENVAVKDGQMMSTDLEVYTFVPTDLPDGMYRLVGKDFEAYPEGTGPSIDDMPVPPKMEGATTPVEIPFPREQLKAALEFHVENAIRPLMGAVCLRVKGNEMQILATDQYALAKYTVPRPKGVPEGDYILPAKAVKTILLDKSSETMEFSVVPPKVADTKTGKGATDGYVSMDTGRLKVIARTMVGLYYQVDGVIPKQFASTATFDTKELAEALKTLAPYVNPEDKAIRLERTDGGYNITAETPSKNLKKTVFVRAKEGAGGTLTAKDLMLVMPMSAPRGGSEPNVVWMQHRYLKQVVDAIGGAPSLHMALQQSTTQPLAFSAEPVAATIKDIEAQLEQELDAAVARSTDLGVVPAAVADTMPKAKAEVDGYWIPDEDVRARWKQSNGVTRLGAWEKLLAAWDDLSRKATREFEHLPRTAENAEIRYQLLELRKQPDVRNHITLTTLRGLIEKVRQDPKTWTLFEGGVVFNDLQHEYDAGRDLPYGMTREQFVKIKENLDAEIAQHPEVKEALARRNKVWKSLVKAYVDAMEAIGFHVEQRFLNEKGEYREDYFHHMVLEHANDALARFVPGGTGQKLRTPTGRGWLKKREGYAGDINRNYVEAEFEVMAQMMFDMEKAKTIALVQSPKYNKMAECVAQAKQANEQAIEQLIMEEKAGYARKHPRAKEAKSDIETNLNRMRGRIAWGFQQLSEMADAGDLWDGDRHEFADVVDSLKAEPDFDVDPDVRNRTFEYLAALKAAEVDGSMQAATILKNVSERREFIRETLGDDYKTWEDMIPEGYVAWQPREGNVFYMANSIPEKIAEQLAEGVLKELGIDASDLRQIMAVGGKRPSYVVRGEIALTLDNLSRPRPSGEASGLVRKLVRAWKAEKILGPGRIVKSNIRNLSGDADAVFVGNPSAFKKVPGVAEDLYRVYFKDAPITGEMKEWFERGGMESTFNVQDIGDVSQLRVFRSLVEQKGGLRALPEKVWRKYWDTANLSFGFRESILRYAAYLDYLEQMQASKDGKPKNFGASIPEEIMALPDIRDRAYVLSNQLLGAYDQVSVLGQALADSIATFWRYREVNFRRYIQLFKNAMSDGRTGEVAGKVAVNFIKRSPMLFLRATKFAMKAGFFWAMLSAFNHGFFPDEEEELPEDVRSKPHLVLGRNPDGSVKYFSNLGAVGDFLEWFGMDAPQRLVGDWLSGRKALGEAMLEIGKAPVNALWQQLTWIKTVTELVMGKKTYPSLFEKGTIRDKWQYLFDQFGLGGIYKEVAGLPQRPWRQRMQEMLVYTDDAGEGSYYDILDEKREFQKKIGKFSEFGGQTSPRSNALYNLKLAIRYQDREAMEKYLAEYIALGGTAQGLETSLRNMHPLFGLNKEEQRVFIQDWLDNEGRARLGRALEFYERVMLGKRETEEKKDEE